MPYEAFLRALKEFNHEWGLINPGEHIVVAVSGGLDSMVLLDALCELRKEWGLTLAVAHFNHELRGKDSSEDESFVRTLARNKGVECYIEHANTASFAESTRLSVQEAARDLRYKFLTRLRGSLGFQKIATAHHADDNAETILFNLFRGAGVHGLSGIPVMRKDLGVVRPLLFATRDVIAKYATEKKIAYREDSSNAQTEYTRNFLRNTLIPQIREQINPNLTHTLCKTGEIFDQLEEYLRDQAARVLDKIIVGKTPSEIVINLKKLHAQPVFLQEHLLLQIASTFVKTDIAFPSVRTMLKLSHSETGTSVTVAKDVVLFRNREQLNLRRVPKLGAFRHTIVLGQAFEFENFTFTSGVVTSPSLSDDPCVEYINAAALGKELVLRSWSDGDWFVPLGMKEKKKLSDFFIDQKVPIFEKQTIPILVSDNDVVWVCGKRLDDRFKITPATKSVLKLEYKPRHHAS